jgi:hypothetical protein
LVTSFFISLFGNWVGQASMSVTGMFQQQSRDTA